MHKLLSMLMLILVLGFGFSTPVIAAEKAQTVNSQFKVGLVSFHFDDGHHDILQKFNEIAGKSIIELLNENKIHSDLYLISNRLFNNKNYINIDEMKALQNDGHVIGGHTRNHPKDLTMLLLDKLNDEVIGGRQALIEAGALNVETFAYPRGNGGNSDDAKSRIVRQVVKDANFIAARSTRDGYNDQSTDCFRLKRMPGDKYIDKNDDKKKVAAVQMKQYIDEAVNNKTWLILVFHQISNKDIDYSVKPEVIAEVINYAAEKRDNNLLKVVTTSEGIKQMQCISHASVNREIL